MKSSRLETKMSALSLEKSHSHVYCFDLPDHVSDEEFRNEMEEFGDVRSSMMCYNLSGPRGCGNCWYEERKSAENAVGSSVFTKGTVIWSSFQPNRNGANLHILGLDGCTNKELENVMSEYGPVDSCRVAKRGGERLRFGFCSFHDVDSAKKALSDPPVMNGAELLVSPFQESYPELLPEYGLRISSLDVEINESVLYKLFNQFGTITFVKLYIHKFDTSKRRAVLFFDNADSPVSALADLPSFGEDQIQATRYVSYTGAERNIYIADLPDISEDALKDELIEQCGPVKHFRIIKNASGTPLDFALCIFEEMETGVNAVKSPPVIYGEELDVYPSNTDEYRRMRKRTRNIAEKIRRRRRNLL